MGRNGIMDLGLYSLLQKKLLQPFPLVTKNGEDMIDIVRICQSFRKGYQRIVNTLIIGIGYHLTMMVVFIQIL